MKKRSFLIGALSDIGYVKKTNQDRILIKIGEEEIEEFGLFVVADGMGGLTAGDKASGMVIAEFRNWWNERLALVLNQKDQDKIDVIDMELNKVILKVNKKIIKFSKLINSKVGTTLSMLFIYKDEYIIKHVGDSRIYKINNDMIKLTKDQSWVAEQIRQGKMNIQEAANHPRKHVLLQCIGVREDIDIFSKKGEVLKEDMFLLCSDGFYNLLKKHEILSAVSQFEKNDEDIQRVAEKLLQKVKARGALDNASVILIYQNSKKNSLIKRLKTIINMLC